MSNADAEGLMHGGCHCANIGMSLEWPADVPEIPARACNCSFCQMHGAVWTSNPGARLVVRLGDQALVSIYAFGTETARFHVCARCGGVPFSSCEIGGVVFAVVNVNALRGIDEMRLRRSSSDVGGEDVQTRLARRERNWIARVEFGEPGTVRVR